MDILITDRSLKRTLLAERRNSGLDRYDEVWNGVYVMSPRADSDHQRLVTRLGAILEIVLGFPGKATIFVGINVSDREEGWTKNFRVPDVAVILPGGQARITEALCVGGPDFVIEIKSRGDRSRQKRRFYASIGVREMLVIDRKPWAIELYRLGARGLDLVGRSTVDEPGILSSEVIPLAFRLVEEEGRPRIEVSHETEECIWIV